MIRWATSTDLQDRSAPTTQAQAPLVALFRPQDAATTAAEEQQTLENGG